MNARTKRALHEDGGRDWMESATTGESGGATNYAPISPQDAAADINECAQHLAPVKRYFAEQATQPGGSARRIGPCAEDVLRLALQHTAGAWHVSEFAGPACQLDRFVWDGAESAPDWRIKREFMLFVSDGRISEVDLDDGRDPNEYDDGRAHGVMR